jgi:endonuclease/exonuclease/phosphatase (EEP) superfamily protein YafD
MKSSRPSLLRRLLLVLLALYQMALIVYLGLRWLLTDQYWWLALANAFALYLFLPLLLVFPLAWILRARRMTAVALLLTIGGIAWLLPPLLPKQAPTMSATPLKIVTFNVLGFEGNPLQREVEWLLTTDADVLVLQEVFVIGEDPRLGRLLAKYPYEARTDASVRIFSRLPFVEKQVIWIEDNPGRTSLRVVVKHQGQDVTIYGVHLSQPRTDKPHFRLPNRLRIYPLPLASRYDETRRNAQIERLLGMIAKESNPVILTGDFNMTPTAIAYDRLAAQLHDAFMQAGGGWGMTYPVARVINLPDWLPPLLRIDYVWHSSHWQTVHYQRGDAQNSDHFPVRVSLALR